MVHGRPLNIDLWFESLDDVENVSFAVGFCNRDGGRIMTIDSDLTGLRWTVRRGQKGMARLRIPELLLEPDYYLLDIGSRSGDNAGLEYFPAMWAGARHAERGNPASDCNARIRPRRSALSGRMEFESGR